MTNSMATAGPHGAQHRATHTHHHDAGDAERATSVVLALTLVTMVVEIGAGWWTGSMALLADGWHMAMHAAAMAVAVFAYRFMRRHQASARFTFGAGKAADLGAFANAVLLAAMAVLIGGESLGRLVAPGPIDFSAALLVAAVGLAVNLVSAWLLRASPHAHGCGHGGHDYGHDHGHDHNREAAFVHVLSDALTSALAIVALYCGRRYGLVWLDPVMGLVGAVIILRWSLALVRRAGAVLLDASPGEEIVANVREIVAAHGDEPRDIRIWPVAAGRYAVMVSAVPTGRDSYRPELLALPGVEHVSLDRSGSVPHAVAAHDGGHDGGHGGGQGDGQHCRHGHQH